MPFTASGGDIALKRNPDTGRYDFDWDLTGPNAGNPKYDDRQTHRTASLTVGHRGQWVMDRTGLRGSVIYLIKHDRSSTASDLENAERDALTKAVVDGAILPDPTVRAHRIGPGNYQLDITTVTPDGNKNPLSLSI